MVTRAALLTMLVVAVFKLVEKYCQAATPTRANRGYGCPSLGTSARPRKTKVKMATLISGCTKAQPMPNTACL